MNFPFSFSRFSIRFAISLSFSSSYISSNRELPAEMSWIFWLRASPIATEDALRTKVMPATIVRRVAQRTVPSSSSPSDTALSLIVPYVKLEGSVGGLRSTSGNCSMT